MTEPLMVALTWLIGLMLGLGYLLCLIVGS